MVKKKIADIISEIDNATTHCDFKEKFGRTFSNFGYNKFAYASSDVDSVDNIDLPALSEENGLSCRLVSHSVLG